MKSFGAALEDLHWLLWISHFPTAPAHNILRLTAKCGFAAMTLQDPGESAHNTGEALKKKI